MAINKNIKALTKDVRTVVDGEEVIAATFHPLTPHDVTTILVKAGANLDGVMKAWDGMELPKINPRSGAPLTADDLAEMMLERAPGLIGLIAEHAPELIADVIAIAAREPDAAQTVQENWSLPLQFDCLSAIAEITFVSPQGFMDFVGKVTALGKVGKAIVRPSAVEKKPSRRPRMDSDAGSTASSTKR